MAGGNILDKMFNKGPYGMALPRGGGRGAPRIPRMSMPRSGLTVVTPEKKANQFLSLQPVENTSSIHTLFQA